MSKIIKLPGRVESAEVGGIVTGANAIMDDAKGKVQSQINSETDVELLRLQNEKQDNITVDGMPTEGSNNPVASGGVYTAEKALSDAIEAILLLIPSAASALNQLADKEFVASSIATSTATFRGTYNLVSDLHLSADATHEEIEMALGALGIDADANDYCFVQVPESDTSEDIKATQRYKFNGTAWAYEYDLNNSGFTAEQWAAINSNITAALTAKLMGLPTSEVLAALLGGKQDALTFDEEPTAGSNNPVTSGGVYQANNDIIALINALDQAKQNVLTFDQSPVQGSSNPVTSGGVYDAIYLVQTVLATLGGNVETLQYSVSLLSEQVGILNALYQALTQSDIIVGALPGTGVANRVYRVPGTSTYADWMWYDGEWVKLAEYTTLDGYVYKGVAVPMGGPTGSAVKMFYIAIEPGTYSNFGNLVVERGINILKYDGANWSKDTVIGFDAVPAKNSQNLVTSGAVFDYVTQNGGAYDISANNPVGGQPAVYETLSDALGPNGVNVPEDVRKGGMSVKFIQGTAQSSANNKYVQYFLNKDAWTIVVYYWEKVNLEKEVGQLDEKYEIELNGSPSVFYEGLKKYNNEWCNRGNSAVMFNSPIPANTAFSMTVLDPENLVSGLTFYFFDSNSQEHHTAASYNSNEEYIMKQDFDVYGVAINNSNGLRVTGDVGFRILSGYAKGLSGELYNLEKDVNGGYKNAYNLFVPIAANWVNNPNAAVNVEIPANTPFKFKFIDLNSQLTGPCTIILFKNEDGTWEQISMNIYSGTEYDFTKIYKVMGIALYYATAKITGTLQYEVSIQTEGLTAYVESLVPQIHQNTDDINGTLNVHYDGLFTLNNQWCNAYYSKVTLYTPIPANTPFKLRVLDPQHQISELLIYFYNSEDQESHVADHFDPEVDYTFIKNFDVYAIAINNGGGNRVTGNIGYKITTVNTKGLKVEVSELEESVIPNNGIDRLPKPDEPLTVIDRGFNFCGIFKDWGFIGDSLSSGVLEAKDGSTNVDYHAYEFSWGQFICRTFGVSGYNFSQGGQTAKGWCNGSGEREAAGAMANPKNVYTIAFGVNDASHLNIYANGIGDADTDVDVSDYTNNADSFAGWYASIIQRLKTVQPKAKFFVITLPLPMYANYSSINAQIRKIANMFDNVYLIDLENKAPAFDSNWGTRYKYGGHLNVAGYLYFANLFSTYVDWIVRNNYQEFADVPLIGTNYELRYD